MIFFICMAASMTLVEHRGGTPRLTEICKLQEKAILVGIADFVVTLTLSC